MITGLNPGNKIDQEVYKLYGLKDEEIRKLGL
jgi:hypothetical protein